MPPHVSGRIVYHPQLPRMRNQLVDRTPMGTTVKAGHVLAWLLFNRVVCGACACRVQMLSEWVTRSLTACLWAPPLRQPGRSLALPHGPRGADHMAAQPCPPASQAAPSCAAACQSHPPATHSHRLLAPGPTPSALRSPTSFPYRCWLSMSVPSGAPPPTSASASHLLLTHTHSRPWAPSVLIQCEC